MPPRWGSIVRGGFGYSDVAPPGLGIVGRVSTTMPRLRRCAAQVRGEIVVAPHARDSEPRQG
jgi:hypothetical protein